MYTEPRKALHLDQEAGISVVRGVQLWDPQLPLICIVMDTPKSTRLLGKGMMVAMVGAVIVRDCQQSQNLYVSNSDTPHSTKAVGRRDRVDPSPTIVRVVGCEGGRRN